MTLAALPSAPEAEAALLGTMLMFPNASRIAIEEGASADDFYNERHRMIFNAMQALYSENIGVDPTTVATRLQEEGTFEKIGGNNTLTTLIFLFIFILL